MDIFTKIDKFSDSNHLFVPGSTIVVALSGGPDSVFLLHYLVQKSEQYGIKIIVAHLNHGWRQESAAEAIFCQKLASDLGITFIGAHASEYESAKKYNGSKEEVGRQLRRQFLESVAQKYEAQYIALGHHADDQQETFFIRMLRGASLTGLVGMRSMQGMYVRPLLCVAKNEILTYLHAHNIAYCTDASNQSNAFLRNRIRNAVIPALKTADARFDITFNKTLSQLQLTEDFLITHTHELWQSIAIKSEDGYAIQLDQLRTLHFMMQQRIIIHWLCANNVPFVPSIHLLQEIFRFLSTAQKNNHTLYQKWKIIKNKNIASIASL